MPAYAYVLVAAMLMLSVGAFIWTPWAVIPLVVLALVWLVVNSPFEGPTLVTLVRDRHGITAADLVSVMAVMLGAWAVVRTVRSS